MKVVVALEEEEDNGENAPAEEIKNEDILAEEVEGDISMEIDILMSSQMINEMSHRFKRR